MIAKARERERLRIEAKVASELAKGELAFGRTELAEEAARPPDGPDIGPGGVAPQGE